MNACTVCFRIQRLHSLLFARNTAGLKHIFRLLAPGLTKAWKTAAPRELENNVYTKGVCLRHHA